MSDRCRATPGNSWDSSQARRELAGGLSPSISIQQKTAGRNPRSTVRTITEIYDYLRVAAR